MEEKKDGKKEREGKEKKLEELTGNLGTQTAGKQPFFLPMLWYLVPGVPTLLPHK